MNALYLHEFHAALGASFAELNGEEIVASYGPVLTEYAALRTSAGVLGLSCRSRLCLVGADRQRFLNGQVTNDVNALKAGQGCYAALITAKGKMLSDLNIYLLEDEILLDFEPGLSTAVMERLEKYTIADDVQIVDASPHYGLLSVQGPQAGDVVTQLGFNGGLPVRLMGLVKWNDSERGDICVANSARTGTSGFDVFVPTAVLSAVCEKLFAAARGLGGSACGWNALEIARIEAGLPRFGADMDETNLPPEAGLEKRAISYTKGCYIGQEVIARVRTYGQVAKALRGLRLADDLKELPRKADKLFKGEKEVGYVTSAIHSPALHANLALGYVRRETNQIGSELTLHSSDGPSPAKIVALPFTA